MLYSELIIFIRYKSNSYCFIYHTQRNIILCSIYTIFDERLFPKYTNFYAKEHKLYNKLLDKISPEIKLLASDPFKKDRLTLVLILYIPIPSIQNNFPTHSSSSSLSYKFVSLLSTLEFKKPTVEIKENDDIDSDIEMQSLSPQWSLQSALQTL